MNIAVITAIIGGIDRPKVFPAQRGTDHVSRYLITGDRIDITNDGRTDREKALFYKCQPHQSFAADIFIWIDGKIQVQTTDFIGQILAAMGDADLAALKHGSRTCIYDETAYIEQQMDRGSKYLITRYRYKPIRQQVEGYRKIGYPANAGLFDCCIVAIRNTQPVIDVLDYWWREVRDYNAFDQTAFIFAAWRLGVQINPITLKPGTIAHVPHLKLV